MTSVLPEYLTDIQATRLFLKRNFDGPEVVKALQFRLKTHLDNPESDPLSNQVWMAYNALPEFMEEPFTILDAGCMSGFLYHFLKRHFREFTYTGIDRWPEALQVARENAPEARFFEADFMRIEPRQDYDYIVCSNIPFKPGEEEITIGNLKPHATRTLFMIYPGNKIVIHERIPASEIPRNTRAS